MFLDENPNLEVIDAADHPLVGGLFVRVPSFEREVAEAQGLTLVKEGGKWPKTVLYLVPCDKAEEALETWQRYWLFGTFKPIVPRKFQEDLILLTLRGSVDKQDCEALGVHSNATLGHYVPVMKDARIPLRRDALFVVSKVPF